MSERVLGSKIERARKGEWQGGPVRLGFDVACFNRATNTELWRVVFEGSNKRLKGYPDGRTERSDGESNFPSWQKKGKPAAKFLEPGLGNEKAKYEPALGALKR